MINLKSLVDNVVDDLDDANAAGSANFVWRWRWTTPDSVTGLENVRLLNFIKEKRKLTFRPRLWLAIPGQAPGPSE